MLAIFQPFCYNHENEFSISGVHSTLNIEENMAKSTKQDMGAGISAPSRDGSGIMKFYKQVQSAPGATFDSRGHTRKTGKQSEKIGSGKCADATKGTGKYSGGVGVKNKGPNSVVSKRTAKPHTLKKGMTKKD